MGGASVAVTEVYTVVWSAWEHRSESYPLGKDQAMVLRNRLIGNGRFDARLVRGLVVVPVR